MTLVDPSQSAEVTAAKQRAAEIEKFKVTGPAQGVPYSKFQKDELELARQQVAILRQDGPLSHRQADLVDGNSSKAPKSLRGIELRVDLLKSEANIHTYRTYIAVFTRDTTKQFIGQNAQGKDALVKELAEVISGAGNTANIEANPEWKRCAALSTELATFETSKMRGTFRGRLTQSKELIQALSDPEMLRKVSAYRTLKSLQVDGASLHAASDNNHLNQVISNRTNQVTSVSLRFTGVKARLHWLNSFVKDGEKIKTVKPPATILPPVQKPDPKETKKPEQKKPDPKLDAKKPDPKKPDEKLDPKKPDLKKVEKKEPAKKPEPQTKEKEYPGKLLATAGATRGSFGIPMKFENGSWIVTRDTDGIKAGSRITMLDNRPVSDLNDMPSLASRVPASKSKHTFDLIAPGAAKAEKVVVEVKNPSAPNFRGLGMTVEFKQQAFLLFAKVSNAMTIVDPGNAPIVRPDGKRLEAGDQVVGIILNGSNEVLRTNDLQAFKKAYGRALASGQPFSIQFAKNGENSAQVLGDKSEKYRARVSQNYQLDIIKADKRSVFADTQTTDLII